MILIEQKDNYIPAWDSLRRCGSTRLTTGGSLLVPSRPAIEDDEDVLASIASRHVSSLGIRPVVSPSTLLPSTILGASGVGEAESPLPDSTGLREIDPKGVFYVRRAFCKSQGEPARGELARGRLVRGRLARVLIVYLVSMTVLTAALCFMTWLDGRRNEEFAQTSILVDGGGNSPKTEDPESEIPGRQNTVIVVDR